MLHLKRVRNSVKTGQRLEIFIWRMMMKMMMEARLPALTLLLVWFDRISEGAGTGCPSSPLCYRNNRKNNTYICEWKMNTTVNVTFHLNIDNKDFGTHDRSPVMIDEELLIRRRPVNISLTATGGSSNCTSHTSQVILHHIVKFLAPRNIRLSWSGDVLGITWKAPEKYPASAEVLYRRNTHPVGEWKTVKRNTNLTDVGEYRTSVGNLAKDVSYQLQLRHRSTSAATPLWSDWSGVIVPAELTHEPELDFSPKLENESRKVTIKWNPQQPVAAAVQGVTYILRETHGCPFERSLVHKTTKDYVTYVSKSSVFISVVAKNQAGYSPRAVRDFPLEVTEHLQLRCGGELQLKGKDACMELYEIQDGGLNHSVITVTKNNRTMKKMIKDDVRYLYFKYKTVNKVQEIEKCLWYQKEGVPRREPQDFIGFSHSQTSANLSWREIPIVDQRGFLTHYHLCSVKVGHQAEERECHNISASVKKVLKYQLTNLTAGVKYNLSVAGVTRAGEGPAASLVLLSRPEDQTMDVLLGIGLVSAFLIITGVLVCVFKRFRGRILPPVPRPIIAEFGGDKAGGQGLLKKESRQQQQEEQAHEFTLHQKRIEETTITLTPMYSDSEMSDSSSNPEFTELDDPGLVETQLASLLYKKGLVFNNNMD